MQVTLYIEGNRKTLTADRNVSTKYVTIYMTILHLNMML